MTKSLLILYTGDDWVLDKPDFPTTELAYATWGDLCQTKNISLYRASQLWFDGTQFYKGWVYRDHHWQKINEAIKPTLIFDKTRLYDRVSGDLDYSVLAKKQMINKVFPITNSLGFTALLDNKLNQSIIFKDTLPHTYLGRQGETIHNPERKKIVLKRFFGSGGLTVYIKDDARIELDHDYLVQDFIDAKAGGVLKDYRLVFFGKEAQYALSRVAKGDSLYTNLTQGAHIEFVDLEAIPELVQFSLKIAEAILLFDRCIYSLDFLIDTHTQKPYLMEFNSMPGFGMFDPSTKDRLDRYLESLTQYLMGL